MNITAYKKLTKYSVPVEKNSSEANFSEAIKKLLLRSTLRKGHGGIVDVREQRTFRRSFLPVGLKRVLGKSGNYFRIILAPAAATTAALSSTAAATALSVASVSVSPWTGLINFYVTTHKIFGIQLLNSL
jgi:hypothetical protein